MLAANLNNRTHSVSVILCRPNFQHLHVCNQVRVGGEMSTLDHTLYTMCTHHIQYYIHEGMTATEQYPVTTTVMRN